ncbi:hypothetical protein U1Q18_020155 [Sarracenia purpurea var. burkii]
MDSGALYPTCVLKVNLACCKACVANVKKLLLGIDGVYGVDIDKEKGLVTVSGTAEPEILVKKIAKKKKKAEILSYQEPVVNKQSKTMSHQENGNKDKDCICTDDSDQNPHEFGDYVPSKVFEEEQCRDPHCRFHHQKPIIKGNDYVPMVKLQPSPPHPRFSGHPPNPYYQHYYREDLPEDRYNTQYPSYYREDFPEDPYRMQVIKPIVYDRPLPQFDPGCWRPPLPPPHYGYYGPWNAYNGNY